MEHLLDAVGVIGNLSWHVLSLLALIGIVLGMSRIKAFAQQLDTVIATVEKIGAATVNSEGKPLLNHHALPEIRQLLDDVKKELESHREETRSHFDDVSRLSSEDKWKNCEIIKCVSLQTVIHKIERILDRFDEFDKRAETSRQTTSVSLETINNKISDLGKESGDITRAIIQVLSNQLANRRDRDQ